MAGVVNLRQARKARERDERRLAGDENAARFGRTKAQKEAERRAAEKNRAHLDAHKRDPE